MDDGDRDEGIEAVRTLSGDHGVEVLEELLRNHGSVARSPESRRPNERGGIRGLSCYGLPITADVGLLGAD